MTPETSVTQQTSLTTVPAGLVVDVDPFTDEALTDPYPLYRALRDAGPAAYLPGYGMWALTRYDQVRAALGDWQRFSSAQGIGLNEEFNRAWAAALIHLDPPAHDEQRGLFTDRLSPRALRPVMGTLDERARGLAQRLAAEGEFDAVTDLAHDLPVHIVMDLIGWPQEGRDQLLDMATGWFDTGGPANARAAAGAPRVAAMIEFLQGVVSSRNLTEGGFGRALLDAHDGGVLPLEAVIGLLAGYVVAAFDTTINLIANGVWLFANHPEQWQLLRSDPGLMPNAINEILRVESPIQGFSRVTTQPVDVGDGVVIPAGERVLVSYAAGNRDERHFADPNSFDLRRDASDHLAFSYGIHACAGQGLARLEATAVLTALAETAASLEPAGEPRRALNNITRGFAALPVRVGTGAARA